MTFSNPFPARLIRIQAPPLPLSRTAWGRKGTKRHCLGHVFTTIETIMQQKRDNNVP